MTQLRPRTGSRPASLAPAGPHAPPAGPGPQAAARPGPCWPPHPARLQPALAPAGPHAPPWAAQGLPVALPGVPHVRVVDAVSVRLLIQEVKHVLDGQGERTAPVHRAEQGLEQVIHELLQGALGEGRWERVRRGQRGGSRRTGQVVPCLDRACLGSLSAMPGCADSTVGGGGSCWGVGEVGRTDGPQISGKKLLQAGATCTFTLVSLPGGRGQGEFDGRQQVL